MKRFIAVILIIIIVLLSIDILRNMMYNTGVENNDAVSTQKKDKDNAPAVVQLSNEQQGTTQVQTAGGR